MKKHKLVCIQLIASASSNEYVLSETYLRMADGAFSHVNNTFYPKGDVGFNTAMHDLIEVMTRFNDEETVSLLSLNRRKVRMST